MPKDVGLEQLHSHNTAGAKDGRKAAKRWFEGREGKLVLGRWAYRRLKSSGRRALWWFVVVVVVVVVWRWVGAYSLVSDAAPTCPLWSYAVRSEPVRTLGPWLAHPGAPNVMHLIVNHCPPLPPFNCNLL